MKSYAPRTATGRALAAIRTYNAAQPAPANLRSAADRCESRDEIQTNARAIIREAFFHKVLRKRLA